MDTKMDIYSTMTTGVTNTTWTSCVNKANQQMSEVDQRSPDSAFGSCEFDQSFDSQCSQAKSQNGNGGRYLTLARSKAPFTIQSPVPFLQVRNLSSGVKVQQFTEKEKWSWIEAKSDRGFIRLFDPKSELKVSVVVPCSLNTTAKDICTKLGLPTNCLHVQYSGNGIERLNEKEKPLNIQNEYLNTIGFTDIKYQQRLGDDLSLGYMIRFFSGRPQTEDSRVEQSLSAFCNVRRGRVFQQWSHRLCVFSGSKILIYPNLDRHGEPDVLCLSRARVEETTSRSRGRCLKITVPLGRKPTHSVFFSFDSLVDHGLWLAACTKASSSVPSISDLSNLQLERIPDQVFAVGSERLLTQLNLRKNNLKERSSLLHLDALSFGWLDDLPKLQSLRCLNLSDNNLSHFPKALLDLPALTELILSGNKISNLPVEINKLHTLKILNLQNNRLSWLPIEMMECNSIVSFDLSFNRFTMAPEVLCRMPSLVQWQLAGNQIENFPLQSIVHRVSHLRKLDLRRNKLILPETIPVGCFDNLAQLDLRDNTRLSEIDLRSLNCLHILNCERMNLKNLILNGTNLVCLHANNNKLESMTVMPVPQNLKVFDLSHNQLKSLPEWLPELKNIEKILVDHNRLTILPEKLFTNASNLKMLILNHNLIRELPGQIENCFIEVLHLHHNKINQLPPEFLASTHRLRILNLAQNFLTYLPSLNPFQDLNKVQHLSLAANCLDDLVIDAISGYRRLKIIDLAYNRIRHIDSRSLERLQFLEQINLSGNRLAQLPTCISRLPNIRVLRAHSNCLTSVPDVSGSQSLKVLDLANNCIQAVETSKFMAPSLKHLDLSCNNDLRMDRYEVDKTEKVVSWIEMEDDGDNLSDSSIQLNQDVPWQMGFSETSGERNKLCITQIRHPSFKFSKQEQKTVGCLFGIVDGGLNDEIPLQAQVKFPEFMQTELENSKKRVDGDLQYLKYSILATHQSLRELGQKMRASCAVCHVEVKSGAKTKDNACADQYILNVANLGHTQAVLCRRAKPLVITEKTLLSDSSKANGIEYERLRNSGAILTETNHINGITPCTRQLGCSFLYPAVIPDPYMNSIELCEEDEFLIVASHGLWNQLTPLEAVRRVRPISNCVLAAKHLQDIAQSYGWTENLSILVIRFYFIQSNIEKKPNPNPQLSSLIGMAQSALNLTENADTISVDSDVQSEPRGPVKEKPNYYFEYKRKLKEMEAESNQTSTMTSRNPSLLSLNGDLDGEKDGGSIFELDPVSLVREKTPIEQLVPKLINESFNDEIYSEVNNDGLGAVFCDKTPNYDIADTDTMGRTIARYGMSSDELKETRFQLIGCPKDRQQNGQVQTENKKYGCISRVRFEQARQQLIEKLQLKTVQETNNNQLNGILPKF